MQIDKFENIVDDRLGRVQSLVRAFGILSTLSHSSGMTLTEVAHEVALPRSTTHRLLATMESLEFVMFDRTKNNWSIGFKAFTVGAAFAHTNDLARLARPAMQALMLEIDQSVNIAVPEANGMCYVGQVQAAGVRRNAARPGACLPMHTTAAGKALMAHWSEEQLNRYLDRTTLRTRTSRSIADPGVLHDELRFVRERGFAVDDEEHSEGLRCVAAVVLDRFGAPRAALSVSDVTTTLRRERIPDIARGLRTAARKVSGEIASLL